MVVSVVDAEHILNLKQKTITFDYYKQKSLNREPTWYTKKKRNAFVDINEYVKSTTLKSRSWLYATDKLYWVFMATGFNVMEVAKVMASRSKYFKNERVWQSFLYTDLFSINDGKIYTMKPNMLFEFIRIGTKYLYLLNKAGRLEEVDDTIFN